MPKKYSTENNIPTVILLGRTNVGKSTLFNRLVGQKLAIESVEAGTTRDWREFIVEKKEKIFKLIDCAGLEKVKKPIFKDIELMLDRLVKSADLLLWVVDGALGLDNQDRALIAKVRSYNKPTWVVVNKCDNAQRLTESEKEFEELGFQHVILLSALHSKNVHTLWRELTSWLENLEVSPVDQITNHALKFSIIGRPNVGKSSLLNALLKFQRSVVSDIPGTTRDAVSIKVTGKQLDWRDNEPIVLSFTDTAGIRRKNKITGNIENDSIKQAIEVMEDSDIILFVMDAQEIISKQDLHVAGLAHKMKKSIIIVVNKWDKILAQKKAKSDSELQAKFIDRLLVRAKFLKSCPIIFTSTATNFNVSELTELLQLMWLSRNVEIENEILDRFVEKCQFPILKRISKIEQISTNPPTFMIYNIGLFQTAEINQLKNAIRETFDLFSTPIKIQFFEPEGE